MLENTSLVNNLLIAMPSLENNFYKKTVIFLCEHNEHGSLGLIINHPMQYHLSWIFEQMNIRSNDSLQNQRPLLFGGPIKPERGFVIHRQAGEWRSSVSLRDGVIITTSNDIIHAFAKHDGPQDAIITLGYSAWDEEQLEMEIKNNAWLVCPYKEEILYDVPFAKRWEYAGSILGVHMPQLISTIGHA